MENICETRFFDKAGPQDAEERAYLCPFKALVGWINAWIQHD